MVRFSHPPSGVPKVGLVVVIFFGVCAMIFLLRQNLGGRQPLASSNGGLRTEQRLREVLEAAAMPARNSVIITTFTGPWEDVLQLWLHRIQVGNGTRKYLRHIVVFCMDHEGYKVCQRQRHIHCFLDRQDDKKEQEAYGGGALKYGTTIMVHMMWRRLELLSKVIHLGFNLLLSDIDVIWFKDPFPWLEERADMMWSCDWWFEDRTRIRPNGGFWYAESNPRTRAFFNYWLEDHEKRWPENEVNMHEQEAFRQIRPEMDNYTAHVIGLRTSYLSTTNFGSFCQVEFDIQLRELVTFHPICVVGKENKRSKMQSVIDAHDAGDLIYSLAGAPNFMAP